MKLKFTLFYLFAFCLGMSSFSQTEKVLDPGTDFLNNLIVGDTASNGDRVPTVYVLKRDAEYLVSGPFENHGWKLHIKAEEGTGKRPIIRAYQDQNGDIPWTMIGLFGDVEFESIFVDGQPSNLDQKPVSWSIVSFAEGADVTYEDCIFVNVGQGAVGIWNAANEVTINNCKFYNLGNMAYSDFGAGRVIDCRSSEVNKLELTNNTFVNSVDRILRHRGGSGVLKDVLVDHNTIVNNAAYHGFIELGNVGDKVQITNNLIVDAMGLGVDQSDATRLTELDAHGEKDGSGNPLMVWVGSIPNETTAYTISKNIYTVSTKLQTFYTSVGVDEGPDQILTAHIKSKLGSSASDAWVKKDFTLPEIPEAMTEFYAWYYSPEGGNKQKVTTSEVNYDIKSYDYWLNDLNCQYSVTDGDFIGTDNVPVGDPNWESSVVTSAKDLASKQIDMVNYPNPFSTQTTLQFKLDQASVVSVDIFDISGKPVRKTDFGRYSAGNNSIVINKGNLGTGMYLLRLNTEGKSGFIKIIVD
jgi:hypothetical protein